MPPRIVKRLFPLIIALLFISNVSFAQKRISGIVKDKDGPVIGATVLVKGTTVATQTDAEGRFSLTVPSGRSVVVISSVSYQTQEIRLTENQSSLDVNMVLSTNTLDEVLITGYTAQRKKEITGAVSVIKTGELTKVAAPSFLGQIEGRA
jgi:TonB-dependent starch-binding outer membrane protein SusC